MAIEVLHIVDVPHLKNLIVYQIQRIRIHTNSPQGRSNLVIVKDGSLLMVLIGRTDVVMAIDMLLSAQSFVEGLLAVSLYLYILIELIIMRLGDVIRDVDLARPMVVDIQL